MRWLFFPALSQKAIVINLEQGSGNKLVIIVLLYFNQSLFLYINFKSAQNLKWICSGCRDVVTSTIFEDGHILAGTFAWLSVIEIILKTFIGRQAVLINCLTRLHFGGSVFSQKCREKRVLECSCHNTFAIFYGLFD